MELSALSENIVAVPYKRGNETLELQVNIDAFTPEFFRRLTSQFKTRLKSLEAQAAKEKRERKRSKKESTALFDAEASALELEREINVEFLVPQVLKGWDVTKDGMPIPPSKEVLITLPPRMIKELLETCVEASKTVKKRVDEETEETSENMPSGSKGLHVVGQAG